MIIKYNFFLLNLNYGYNQYYLRLSFTNMLKTHQSYLIDTSNLSLSLRYYSNNLNIIMYFSDLTRVHFINLSQHDLKKSYHDIYNRSLFNSVIYNNKYLYYNSLSHIIKQSC